MLETIWFVLWGVLWAVYFMLDGYVLGLGTLMPFIAHTDTERRIIYNASGPFWDGNQVWLITAGGVTFAAFPGTYATMFSGLYSALLLLLFALILRGVTFEFRSKLDNPTWRRTWDICKFLGSFLPALLLGVAFANIFAGIPIDAEGIFQGNLFTLLNPYGLAGGVLFVLMFLVHGALWLANRAEGVLHDRAVAVARSLWPLLLVWTVAFLAFSHLATHLFANYSHTPALSAVPALCVVALITMRVFMAANNFWGAWGASALFIVTCALFGVIGIYPALLPSSLDPAYSMTIHNSASSALTLKIMLGVALTFVPIVIIYQAWAYKTFGSKVDARHLEY